MVLKIIQFSVIAAVATVPSLANAEQASLTRFARPTCPS